MSKHADHYQRNKKQIIQLIFAGIFIWIAIIIFGMRLPYLNTHFAFQIRAFVIFPLLFIPLFYLNFIYVDHNKDTAYRKLTKSSRGAAERLKSTFFLIVGLVLIPGVVAWTSIAFPAVVTSLFATQEYVHPFRVVDISARGGGYWSVLYELELQDESSGEQVSERLNFWNYKKHKWQAGDIVCLTGRTWILGTIVDDTKSKDDSCLLKP